MLIPGSGMFHVLDSHGSVSHCLSLRLLGLSALAPSGEADALQPSQSTAHLLILNLPRWTDHQPAREHPRLGPAPGSARHNTEPAPPLLVLPPLLR